MRKPYHKLYDMEALYDKYWDGMHEYYRDKITWEGERRGLNQREAFESYIEHLLDLYDMDTVIIFLSEVYPLIPAEHGNIVDWQMEKLMRTILADYM